MIKIIFKVMVWTCMFLTSAGYGQTILDSLQTEIKNATSVENKIDKQLIYTKHLSKSNKDSALIVLHAVLKEAEEISYNKGIAQAEMSLGNLCRFIREYDQATAHYLRGAEIAKKYDYLDIQGECEMMAGFIFENKRELEQAIPLYHSAISCFKKTENHRLHGRSLWMLGNTYLTDQQYNKALELFHEGKELFAAAGDSVGIYDCYTNMALAHIHLTDNKKALSFLIMTEDFYRRINQLSALSASLNNQAHIYGLEGELETALKKSLEAYELKKRLSSVRGVATSELIIADIYQQLNNLSKAEEYYQLAIKHSMDGKAADILQDGYSGLYKIFKESGKNARALHYYELMTAVKDSLYTAKRSSQIATLQTQYETEKKEQQIELLEKKEDLQNKELEKNRIIIYSTAGGLFLLVLLAGALFRNNKQQKKANQIISAQKAEVTEQKFLLEEKNTEITASISYAERIQAAILPQERIFKNSLTDSFIIYKPKDIVAGDFYWIEAPSNSFKGGESLPLTPSDEGGISQLPSGRAEDGLVLFAAADCTGHGVPGALVSVLCSNALNRATNEFGITDPGKILDKVTDLVLETFEQSEEDVKDGMDIALCGLQFSESNQLRPLQDTADAGMNDSKNHLLHYAGANNPLWIIRSAKGGPLIPVGKELTSANYRNINSDQWSLHEIKPDKQPIGKYDKRKPFTTHTIELQKGDTIYLFSDGYPDQFGGPKGKKFKYRSFKELLLSIQDKSMEDQKTVINATFEKWKGGFEQVDDVCVIGLRI